MKSLSSTQIMQKSRGSRAVILVLATIPIIVIGILALIPVVNSIIVISLITIFTMIFAWCIWSIHNFSLTVISREEDMAFQVDAFNAHSLVTIADNDNRVTYVNDNFLRTTGFQRQDLLGQPTSVFFPDADILLNNEICDAVLSGNNWIGETLIVGKDNQGIWTHVTVFPRVCKNGEMVGSIAIRTDITETKVAMAEKNLRRSLHILRDEVYMYETDTLRYIYLNQAAMKRCKWDEATYTQKTIADRDLKFENREVYDLDAFYERVAPLINNESKEVEHELLIDGCIHEVKTQIVHPEGGKSYFISIVRDISERRMFERTKNDFISTVSHELRTPVTSIKGALALILSGAIGEPNEKTRNMLDIAHRNTDRLTFLINDILDLEKIAAGLMEFNCESVDMSKLVSDTIHANKAYASNFGVTYKFVGSDLNINGYCDSDRVFQVMNNLLSNAAKFSHADGEVVVSLSQTDDNVCISVQDFGVGIPDEAQASIFDRFAQADSSDQRAKQGTGLGLSIAKALVERQDGLIYFVSEQGKGTKFSFELPKEKQQDTVPKPEMV